MQVDVGGTRLWFDLRPGIGRLDVVARAGHFAWLDNPDGFWPPLVSFVAEVAPTG